MKRFKRMAAQGDMMLVRIESGVPATATPITPENGEHILTHSETGHHHVVLERPGVELFQDAMDLLRSYLVIPEGYEAPLIHKREGHTHETLIIEPGTYMVVRQREFDVTAGWRVAAD